MVLPFGRSNYTTANRFNLISIGRRRADFIGRPSNMERSPIIIEWGAWMVKVGFADDGIPKHFVLPDDDDDDDDDNDSNNNSKKKKKDDNYGWFGKVVPQTPEEWYFIIHPILIQCWDRLLLSHYTNRKVVILHPPIMPRAWEIAIAQSLWNLGVPAYVFVSILDTPPLALEWNRGMLVHVGKSEVCCLAHADGHSLKSTLTIAPCGYEAAVSDASKVVMMSSSSSSSSSSFWTNTMDQVWLNETNPNSLILAIVKCIEATPMVLRKDVADNIVFCGETILIVPALPTKVCQRLYDILDPNSNTMMEDHASELTLHPVNWNTLRSLTFTPQSTGPYRADMVSWIGAALWATVWHRHGDEDNSPIPWTYAPAK
jgi:hypothetical protein